MSTDAPREERTLIQVLDLLFRDVAALRREFIASARGDANAQLVANLLAQIRGHLERSIKLHADLAARQDQMHRQQLSAIATGHAQITSGLLEVISNQMAPPQNQGAPAAAHTFLNLAWPHAMKLRAAIALAVVSWASALWAIFREWIR